MTEKLKQYYKKSSTEYKGTSSRTDYMKIKY
jgi:hypothetical protein